MGLIFRPETYGAIPMGDLLLPAFDCRPAFQAAVDACIAAGGGDVVVGPGRWLLSRAPAGSYNRFAALSFHGPNVRLVGAGTLQTTIVMAGDAGASTFNGIQLDPGASNVVIGGFTIDSTGLYNTDLGEQTHAIVIGSGVCTPINGTDHMPVRDVVVRDVRFLHDGAAGERWGDAIRVGGNTEATAVINVKLLNLDFLKVGRSGVAMQRNVNGLLIQGCYFDANNIGGSAIDGEMTPGSGLPSEWPVGLVIDGNTIVRTLAGGDNYAISMTSQVEFAVTGNVLVGRGISMVRCSQGSVVCNTIDATDQLAQLGSIAIDNLCRDIVISGNTVRRRGQAGPVVKVQPHSGVFPGDLIITGNAITNETEGAAIMLVSPRDTIIASNKLTGSGAPASMGVYVDAGSRDVEGLVITGNVFRGAAYAPVRLAANASHGFIGAAVTGNVSRASGPGIRVDNPQSVTAGGIVAGLNNWSTASTFSQAGQGAA